MKKLRRTVASNHAAPSTNIYFTLESFRKLLLQIDELKNSDITVEATPDGYLEITIGNTQYRISDVTDVA